MASLPDTTRRNLRILDSMHTTRELSGRAVSRLRRAMLAGEDAYPYYSLDGRPFVWSDGRRFTASAYNALAYREELTPDGEGFYPVVLWRLATPGHYYTDADGETWATFTSGERIPCDVCGATIQHGYRTPDTASTPARHVCIAHVAAHPGEGIGETHTPDECPTCEGTGEVSEWVPYGMGNVAMPVPCDCACHGEPDGE